ncbi:hypothetical protein K440DRAFT_373923 [Wilcoxina mikolae CBS 423.85]|nr:hypothetical protein K440DRAFT_373923 [Wilcoxina mikolae CBS 423.85]
MSLPRLFFRANLPWCPLPRFFTTAPPTPRPSLSARLKSLSKEYGYSALGVYLGLSLLDFPLCFLAVRTIGSERIGEYEHLVVEKCHSVYKTVGSRIGLPVWKEHNEEMKEEKEKREGKATIWTELALAYAIHKSLIFIRVPVTAAVTPKVVKTLRGWGWDIGKKGKPKIVMPGKKGKGTD